MFANGWLSNVIPPVTSINESRGEKSSVVCEVSKIRSPSIRVTPVNKSKSSWVLNGVFRVIVVVGMTEGHCSFNNNEMMGGKKRVLLFVWAAVLLCNAIQISTVNELIKSLLSLISDLLLSGLIVKVFL